MCVCVRVYVCMCVCVRVTVTEIHVDSSSRVFGGFEPTTWDSQSFAQNNW